MLIRCVRKVRDENTIFHEGITVLGSKTNEYYDMQIKFTVVKLNTVLQKEYNTVVKII